MPVISFNDGVKASLADLLDLLLGRSHAACLARDSRDYSAKPSLCGLAVAGTGQNVSSGHRKYRYRSAERDLRVSCLEVDVTESVACL